MWPRVVETMLSFWLAASPFIFGHGEEDGFLWANDLGCAAFVLALSLLSFDRRFGWARFGTLAVAVWLAGSAYVAGGYLPPPGYQNEIGVGILLAMLAIIPNEANLPPRGWRKLER